jgi:hypothetical protein
LEANLSASHFEGSAVDTAFKEQLLHIAIAQGEAVVEPDPMADDFAGKLEEHTLEVSL